jgi:hypothetical protein
MQRYVVCDIACKMFTQLSITLSKKKERTESKKGDVVMSNENTNDKKQKVS